VYVVGFWVVSFSRRRDRRDTSLFGSSSCVAARRSEICLFLTSLVRGTVRAAGKTVLGVSADAVSSFLPQFVPVCATSNFVRVVKVLLRRLSKQEARVTGAEDVALGPSGWCWDAHGSSSFSIFRRCRYIWQV
jgi:hypothetical protein